MPDSINTVDRIGEGASIHAVDRNRIFAPHVWGSSGAASAAARPTARHHERRIALLFGIEEEEE
jgi:hypothetical protein